LETSLPRSMMLPLGLPVEARNGAQKRGLPAARGAEEAHELPLADLKVDGFERLEGPEALRKAADGQERPFGRAAAPRMSLRHGSA
jgi:hypothetical protein